MYLNYIDCIVDVTMWAKPYRYSPSSALAIIDRIYF